MTPRPPRQVPPPPRDPSAPPRTSSYSRFIPREEVQSFAAWNPDAFHGAVNTQRAPISAPAPANAQPEVAEPAPPPEPDLQELLHAARQTGYQDGYRDGMAALEAFKQAHATQTTGQVMAVIDSFQASLGQLEQHLASRVAGIAMELARQVVRDELRAQPQHVVTVAKEALGHMLMSARHIVLHVHPDDHALVMAGAGESLTARHARVAVDALLDRGSCVVTSDIGEVDASVATRWQRAMETVGAHLPWPVRDGVDDRGAEPVVPKAAHAAPGAPDAEGEA